MRTISLDGEMYPDASTANWWNEKILSEADFWHKKGYRQVFIGSNGAIEPQGQPGYFDRDGNFTYENQAGVRPVDFSRGSSDLKKFKQTVATRPSSNVAQSDILDLLINRG